MLKKFLAMTLLVAAVFAETAYFKVEDKAGDAIVIQLNDDFKISHARRLVSKATTDRPHIQGRIKKEAKSYNPKYSYYINPDTIDFFDLNIEVCDANFKHTEDHLEEACTDDFLPGCFFCPWTSKLVEEVKV